MAPNRSGVPTGGPRSDGTRQTSHLVAPITYQSRPASLENPLLALPEAMQDVARLLLESAVNLSTRERQFLYELASRSEVRHGFKALAWLLAISKKAQGAARYALPESLRGHLASDLPAMCWTEAFVMETMANSSANEAQDIMWRDKSPGARDRCIDALTNQEAATRQALDALHAWRLS